MFSVSELYVGVNKKQWLLETPPWMGPRGENFEIRLSNLLQMDCTRCFYIKISLDVKFIYFIIATIRIIFSKSVALLTALSIFRFNFEFLIPELILN